MKKKQWFFFGAFLLLLIYYFSVPMNIFWDSGHYMSFVSIFEGSLPWKSWDIVRGPIFPLIIYFSNFLFGKTSQGILILGFIFYFGMLIAVKLILDEIFKREKKKKKNIFYIGIFSFLILNPIIYGYYHALLTEFVAMSVSLFMCYFSWRWIKSSFFQEKKNYLFYSLLFLVGTIFSWHLKQPYVSITIFPVMIAGIISVICNWNLKNVVQRLGTIFSCIIALIVSIILWNQFLAHQGIRLDTDRNVTASFGNQLIVGLNNYEVIDNSNELTTSKFLSKEEQKLAQDFSKNRVVNIKKPSGEVIDQEILSLNQSGNIKTGTAIRFILKQMVSHPYLVLESYVSNYLAIANIYSKSTEDSVSYSVNKKVSLSYCHENCSIATDVVKKKSNISYMPEESYQRVINYEQYNASPIIFRFLLESLSDISNHLFQLILLILPLLVIASTVSILRNKKSKYQDLLAMIIILCWYSLLHILVHVVTGANIDRYASPVYIPIVLSFILYGYYISKNVRKKKEK